LPGELESLARAHDQVGRVVLELQSLIQLTDLRQSWRRYEARLRAWKATLEREWTELHEAFESVSFLQTTWVLTREAEAARPETSASLLERIDAVLAAATDVESRMQRQRERLLDLAEQIDEALAGVNEVLTKLGEAEESVRARLVVRNALPLRSPAAWRFRYTGRGLRRPGQEEWGSVRDLVRFDLHRVLLHLLIFALFLAIAIRLRSRIEDEPSADDPELRAAAETLGYPVSAALLLAVLLADPLYPHASFAMRQVLGLIAVVPVWRLLPRSRVRLVNHAMRALLVLVAVTGVAELVLGPQLDYRFLHLTLAIVIVAGAWWLVVNEAPGEDEDSAWGRVVLRSLEIGIVVGALAILANVFGWTLLSGMILTALIGTAYTGLGTVIGYRVLAGVVRLTPHSRLGQASRALRLHGDVITSRIIRVLRIAAFPLWIWLALRYSEVDEPVVEWLHGLLARSIEVGILHISLANVLNFAITLLLTIWVARFVRFVLDEEVLPRLHPEVLKYPEPQVLFLGFGDSSLDFRLMSWTGTFDDFLRIRSELNIGTHDALADAGITIPFPQRDLHIKSSELPPTVAAP